MRILTFGAYFTPEIAASMYLAEDMLEGMVKAGHHVEMYAPIPTRGISDDVRKEYKKKKKEVLYDGKLIIHRFSLYREGKNTLLRALRYAFLNVAFIWKGLFTKADVIYAQSTPPTQGMMAGIVKYFKKIPFVYNLQDIFPDSLVNTGMTQEGSLIWQIGRKIESYTYKHVDKIIVISDDFKKNIMTKGVPESKIVVVPNWADTKSVYPVDREKNILIDRYNLDSSKFYITYCGNIGYTQNMDMLLDAAKELKDDLHDLTFVLIGEGAAKDAVKHRVKTESIDNIIMIPFQPYEDIAHVFSLGDVGLIISKPGVGNNSVPSKAWSIMAAERPILASFDTDSDLCRLIKNTECGLIAEAGNKEQLKNAVRKMYADRNSKMGKHANRHLKDNLDKDKCIRIYVDTIENC